MQSSEGLLMVPVASDFSFPYDVWILADSWPDREERHY